MIQDRLANSYTHLRDAFLAIDKDKNGVISIDEFALMLKNINIELTDHEFAVLTLKYDSNNDGKVEYSEFLNAFVNGFASSDSNGISTTLLTRPCNGLKDLSGNPQLLMSADYAKKIIQNKFSFRWSQVKNAFITLDCDNNGVLSKEEFRGILKMFNIDMEDEEYDKLMRDYDTNGDNQIDYNEFFTHFGPSDKDLPANAYPCRTSLLMDPYGSDYVRIKDKEVIKKRLDALSDDEWRMIYKNFLMEDSLVTGWTSRENFERIINSQLCNVTVKDFQQLFESCGSHINERLNYQKLIELYRPGIQKSHSDIGNDIMQVCIQQKLNSLSADQWHDFLDKLKKLNETGITEESFEGLLHKHVSLRDEQINYILEKYLFKAVKGTISLNFDKFYEDFKEANPTISQSFGNDAVHDSVGNHCEQDQIMILKELRENVQSLETSLLLLDKGLKGLVDYSDWESILKEHGVFSTYTKSLKRRKVLDAFFLPYRYKKFFKYRDFLMNLIPETTISSHTLQLPEQTSLCHNTTVNSTRVSFLLTALLKDRKQSKRLYKIFQSLDTSRSGHLPYLEIRRGLEHMDIEMSDDEFNTFANYYDIDKNSTISYLNMLHSLGGCDPNKEERATDISSVCSYYSAIGISPKSLNLKKPKTPKPLIEQSNLAADVIVKLSSIHENQSNIAKTEEKFKKSIKDNWQKLNKNLLLVDNGKTGTVSKSTFKKVLLSMGIGLSDEDVQQLCRKYDAEGNGFIQYSELLKTIISSTTGWSEYASSNRDVLSQPSQKENQIRTIETATYLPQIKSSSSMESSKMENLKQHVRGKWKTIYTSFKKLDPKKKGIISTIHFRKLLEWYEFDLSENEVYSLVRMFDRSLDGHIDYNKFMKTCLK